MCHHLSERNVKLILKILSDLGPLRGSSNKKTLYSTRSCVHSRFKMAHACQKRPNLHKNSSNKLLFCKLLKAKLQLFDHWYLTNVTIIIFIFKRSKIAPLCISIKMVKLSFFFLSGVEVLQVLGIEVSHRRLDRVKCKII
jgi:hypothetical protein